MVEKNYAPQRSCEQVAGQLPIFVISGMIILMLLMFAGILPAQTPDAPGYLILPDSSTWTFIIDDSVITPQNYPVIPVAAGNHSLRLAPRHSRNWLERGSWWEINVQPAETLRVNPQPAISAATPYLPEVQQISRPDAPWNLRRFFSGNDLKPALLATAVVANWAAFALKRQADDYYNRYQKTSDLSRMQNYYSQTKTFDNAASVALGVSITALSAYFYFLLTE
jgi:hypothetical protein